MAAHPPWRPALIATDVDGTLLDGHERVTPRTRAAVEAARSDGTRFVLATGRPPRWIAPVVDGLGFAPPAVCANGAVIYDPATDRVVSALTLSPEVLAALADIALRVVPGAGLAVERVGAGAHDDEPRQFVSSPAYVHAWHNPDNTEVDLAEVLALPAVKLLIRSPGARSADLAAALSPLVAALGDLTYSTDNGLVEVVARGVSKADGVARVAAPWGIGASDVIAFGDMPNDIALLQWAGHGVAMGNAAPAVLAAADEVTSRHTEDGLARVLERWWPQTAGENRSIWTGTDAGAGMS